MKNKILIPLLVLGALATFFSFRYSGGDGPDADKRKKLVLQTVVKTISEAHFSPRAIDDSFSNRVFNKTLEHLDYDKKFFTKEDVDQLSAYQFQLDDQIKDGSIEFFEKFNEIFSKRIEEAEKYYKEILDEPFTFTGNETIELNGDKLAFVPQAQLKERWRTYLKFRTLQKYVDLQKARDNPGEDTDEKTAAEAKKKSNAELEKEAREAILKNHNTFFKRLKKIDDDDRFAIYVNSITHSMDPHTEYMTPDNKKRFDVAMSGTFYGIGAQLKEEEGKIKVAAIIPGTPSWKQGDLKAGDEIIKVAQGKAEPVDVQGFDIDEAVKMIRGKKGSEVRLTVRRVDGSTKVIPIVRDEVLLEEVFAKSAVIQSPEGPMGYIYLPEFYADFQNRNGRRSGVDVAIEVQKLKEAGVKGIILDLRNNGGGSLSDVIDMAGLFIDQGPVVQVKASGIVPQTMSDERKGVLWDGPLVVMVNQNSASASEILAAAMQDYKRGIIVGTPTFGKGTVQRIISLDEVFTRSNPLALVTEGSGYSSDSPFGSLKITTQKFYRVNGGSTQLNGVTPDIILPDPYYGLKLGERRDKAALPWDEIKPAAYETMANAVNVAALAELSKKRVANNPTFKVIKESAARIKEREENNIYVLNETAYKKELEEANATSKKLEEIQKKSIPFEVINLKSDMTKINMDSSTVAKNQEWIKALQKDVYLYETVNILNDLRKMQANLSMDRSRH